jgi:predicted RNase H-like nuclease (RuvC/YqgF family)
MTVKELAIALKEAFDWGSDVDQALDYVHVKYGLSPDNDISGTAEELEELEDLRSEVKELESLVDENDDLRYENKDLEGKCEDLEDLVEEQESTIEELKAQIETLTNS